VSEAPRVAVVTGDVTGASMAGPAIRSVELARALHGAGLVVELVVPPGSDVDAVALPCRVAAGGQELRDAVGTADVLVVFSAVVAENPWMADLEAKLVVDAYDPGLLETLERFRGAPLNEQRTWVADSLRHLVEPLRAADVVLVASAPQRHLVIGALTALGRVGPRVVAEDPAFDRLVIEVPFGVPEETAVGSGAPALRQPAGPVPADRIVALWGGGLYDWLDPLTLVEAVDRCRDDRVTAVLLAGPHPTPAVGRLPLVDRARQRARELGLLGDRVVLVEQWVPYEQRVDWLLQSDIGVSLHHHHLETEFAYRTRVLDYLWAGLPVLCSDGDVMAGAVAAHDLGIVVPSGDAEAVAAGLDRLAGENDAERAARRERAGRLAERLRWSVRAEPLVRACLDPGKAPDRRVGDVATRPRGRAGAVLQGLRAARRGLRGSGGREQGW